MKLTKGLPIIHSGAKVKVKLPFPSSSIFACIVCQLSFLSEPHFCTTSSFLVHSLLAFHHNENKNYTYNNAPQYSNYCSYNSYCYSCNLNTITTTCCCRGGKREGGRKREREQ